MRLTRPSISALMAVVLIVALDFGIVRALTRPLVFSGYLTDLLLVAGLPMANVLAVGLAILVAGRRRHGPSRPALDGFVRFGLAAWLAFLACSLLATNAIHESARDVGTVLGLRPGFGLVSFAAIFFLLPQVGFATIGWRLGRLKEGRRA